MNKTTKTLRAPEDAQVSKFNTMKALRVHGYDQTPSIDEVPIPTIRNPQDIIVKIGAAGVCRTDLHVVEGQWKDIQNPELPYTIGHENAGWVHAKGSGVTNLEIGDAVILHPLATCGLCLPCRNGQDSHCEDSTFPGLNTDGGMAEYLLTSARAAIKLPSAVKPVEVAALADAGLTAYHAVKKAVPLLPPGSKTLVLGAGGLGHIGVQVLRALSATEITVADRSDVARDLALSIGADYSLDTADKKFKDAVAAQEFDVVFDFIGEMGMENTGIQALRNRGSYFSIGYGGQIQLDTIEVISREINVVGNLVGTYVDLVELITLTAQGKVSLTSEQFPLSNGAEVLQQLHDGKIRGRAVLVPDNLITNS